MSKLKLVRQQPNDSNHYLFWQLFLSVTALRIFLASRLGLGDDEAYYWDWSRFLDWSYFDHPGMTAWLIKLSEWFLGSSAFSVRFFALVLNSIAWILVYKLSDLWFGRRCANWTALLYFLIPIFGLGGLMMVPDIPMIFAWLCILYFAWIRLNRQESHTQLLITWSVLGALLGLGFLSKYTMIMVVFSLGLFLITTKSLRWQLMTPWPWLGILLALFLTIPVFIWNNQHGWPSFQYQFLERHRGSGFNLSKWFVFWVSQLGILTPGVFILFIVTAIHSIRNISDLKWKFIACFSWPLLIIFSFQAAFSDFKMHWTAPAYITLLIAAPHVWFQTRKYHRLLTGLVMGFLIPLNFIFYAETLYPIAPKIFRVFEKQQPFDPKWDPINDLYGWPEAAHHVQKLRAEYYSKTGRLPFLTTHRYQLSSALAFAAKEKVYCFSGGLDHYDYVSEYSDLTPLLGQDAIIVGDNKYEDDLHAKNIFTSCEHLPELKVYRQNELARIFQFFLCKDFKGFPKPH